MLKLRRFGYFFGLALLPVFTAAQPCVCGTAVNPPCTSPASVSCSGFNNIAVSIELSATSGVFTDSQSGCQSWDETDVTSTIIVEPGPAQFDITMPFVCNVCGLSDNFARVFFDWNRDGDFNDTGESRFMSRSLSGYPNGAFDLSNIGVPAGTADGPLRVRVRLYFEGTSSSPCAAVNPGETVDFIIQVQSPPLPVELMYLNAERENAESVQLSWATCSEANSSHFIVERSIDLQTFEALELVQAQGTSSAETRYTFMDNQSPSPDRTWFYRLKQVDLDGSEQYSYVAMVEPDPKAFIERLEVTLYPNPGHGFTHLNVADYTGQVEVHLYDALGQLLYQTEKYVSKGHVEHLLDLERHSPGIYFVALQFPETNEQAFWRLVRD